MSNQHLLAFKDPSGVINILRMDSLLDESKKTAEEVEMSQIAVLRGDSRKMCMNTTTLLFTAGTRERGRKLTVVNKKDFWV